MSALSDAVAVLDRDRAAFLSAVAAHLDHHTRQIARLRAADGFPA